MPDNKKNVFVSYSHADESLVAPVVKLLRINRSLVFKDTDSIRPGKKWRDEIAGGLAHSDLVVVFWCDHANSSVEVSKEWKAAIDRKIDLLPLLLDSTPLPSELSEFQWIDFRELVGRSHLPLATAPQQAPAVQDSVPNTRGKARASSFPEISRTPGVPRVPRSPPTPRAPLTPGVPRMLANRIETEIIRRLNLP